MGDPPGNGVQFPEKVALSKPCRCGSFDGIVRPNGPHFEVRCAGCDRHDGFRSKAALGLPGRRVETRENIKPRQRARILMRDGGRCFMCGSTDGPMHIGHVLSVDDCERFKVSDEDRDSDENLVTMCEACNLGLGAHSLPPRWGLRFALMLHARLAQVALAARLPAKDDLR